MRTLGLTMLLAFSSGLFAQAAPKIKAYKGEVADSSCAFNVHSLTRSHQEMLKAKSTGADPSSCARYCVKHLGADFVLVDRDKIYRLADQPLAVWEAQAGKQLTVFGVLDPKTSTIHVDHIER